MTDTAARLEALFARRILILDGAMGTMIQRHQLTEADFRGARLADQAKDQRGNSDLLNLTQPGVISSIHHEYLAAGAQWRCEQGPAHHNATGGSSQASESFRSASAQAAASALGDPGADRGCSSAGRLYYGGRRGSRQNKLSKTTPCKVAGSRRNRRLEPKI